MKKVHQDEGIFILENNGKLFIPEYYEVDEAQIFLIISRLWN